jgi:hypothetical protein
MSSRTVKQPLEQVVLPEVDKTNCRKQRKPKIKSNKKLKGLSGKEVLELVARYPVELDDEFLDIMDAIYSETRGRPFPRG